MNIGRYEVADSSMRETVLKKSGASIEDIMDAILKMHNKGLHQTRLFAENFDFTTKSGFKKLWRTIRNDIRYVPDRPGKEVVKSPSALYQIGVGDCKSFTIAAGTTMENAGVEVYYDLVHYGNKNQAHIYPVAYLNGEEIVMDSVYHLFNRRHPGEKWRMRYNPTTRQVVGRYGGRKVGLIPPQALQGMITAGAGGYFLLFGSGWKKIFGALLLIWGANQTKNIY